MFAAIIICLIVVYFIGKYIAAKNRDRNRTNTAEFGENLAGFSKSVGCLMVLVYAIIIFLGALLVAKFLFY